DLGKFAVVHLRASLGQPTPPFNFDKSSIEHLQKPLTGTHQAIGWDSEPTAFSGGGVITHRAPENSFYVDIMIIPGRERVYIAATNTDSPEGKKAATHALAALRKMRKGGL